MEITGGVVLLVLAIGARVVEVRRNRKRRRLQQRLANDMAVLLQRRA